MASHRAYTLYALALLALLLPALVLGWVRFRGVDRLSELEPESVPIIDIVREIEVNDSQPVTAHLEWSDPLTVVAPSWAGTTTALFASSGSIIETGDPILAVNGVTRLAVASDAPFWRVLSPRDEGSDVVALQTFLFREGLFTGEIDGTFGSQTAAAVKELASQLGTESKDGSFDPTWLLWLPSQPFVVESVQAAIAAPAPAPGEQVLIGLAEVLGIQILNPEQQEVEAPGEWLLEIEGSVYELQDGVLTDAAREVLSSALSKEIVESQGMLKRRTPITVIELPATAVATSEDGTLCVWLATQDGEYAAETVSVGTGAVSRVLVRDGLVAGDRVLLNPAETIEDPSCPLP